MIETERFLAWQEPDHPEAWNIKPLDVSGLWEWILGDEWWFLFEEEMHLRPLFAHLSRVMTGKADGESVYEVELEVEYEVGSYRSSLEWRYMGSGRGSTARDFWRLTGQSISDARAAYGFVRTVKMALLNERSLSGRQDEPGDATRGRDLALV